MKRPLILVSMALALIGLAGCNTWERTTYQTLAASQAVINQAQTDYEASAGIPHNRAAYTVINKAKAAQTLAVNSFVTYEEAKAAGGTQASITALQADVAIAIAALPTIIADVKALYTKQPPDNGTPGVSTGSTNGGAN